MKYIYILTNPSFQEDIIKVGIATNVSRRLKELDTTGLPSPFKCYFAMELENAEEVEAKFHSLFGQARIRDNREFFQIDPEAVKLALIGAFPKAKIYDKLDNKMIDGEGNEIANAEIKITRRARFSFGKLKILPGSELIFTRDPSKKCIVKDADNKVLYDGKEYTLTSLSVKLDTKLKSIWEKHNGGVQGTAYWKYKGKTINELSQEQELEN